MSERAALRALSERLSILPRYRGVDGHDRALGDESRAALCAAMGHPADSEDEASRALAALDHAEAERLIAPVLVWREWEHGKPELLVAPGALGGARDYTIALELESGEIHRGEGALPDAPDPAQPLALPLPFEAPLGYHTIRLCLDGHANREATQRLVIAPRTAFAPEEALGAHARGSGVIANLYSVRGQRDRGHGTLHDLATLARAAGAAGAAFVGVNPLHAVGNRGFDFAPYSPWSRLFRNVLYLDLEDIPELTDSPRARALLAEPALRARREALRAAARIDHARVLALVEPVLRALYDTFRALHRGRDTERGRAYVDYLAREGTALIDFATWEVLALHHGRHSGAAAEPCTEWWQWPEVHRDPRSPEVALFREREAVAVDFRCWLQFELDRQLAVAADVARRSGCALGLYTDLALGASRASADVWMAARGVASGVNLGAPPDDYAPEGQDWGLPPLDPHQLRADGYRAWSRLLRAVFRSTGVLRLDHAMGLLRQFWIPVGRPGSAGGYVAYPASDLLGIVALESRRARAVVVAEDLGTVPPELPGLLEDWGLLRSAVVHFMRDTAGDFLSSAQQPRRALCTFGTHDLPPFAGLWEGQDLLLDRALGRIESDAGLAEAQRERAAYRADLLDCLRGENLVDGLDSAQGAEPDPAVVLPAVHAFLARTPCVLIAASLDDVGGERERVNVPGVPLDQHPSWSRRMRCTVEELDASGALQRALAPLCRSETEPETREELVDSPAGNP